MDKEHVLAEIRRTAEANGGKPLGVARFAAATGIQQHDWRGRYWARWNDALDEAGFPPNKLQGRYPDELLFGALASEVRRIGKMPTTAELKMSHRENPDVPDAKVFERRLGPKATWAGKVSAWCRERPDYADILPILEPLIEEETKPPEEDKDAAPTQFGFVYLMRSGRYYKIGRANSAGRRAYEVGLQQPEPVTLVHEIRTDDPAGIERYWHQRFAARHKNGEWFELTAADVSAFKRRQFQ